MSLKYFFSNWVFIHLLASSKNSKIDRRDKCRHLACSVEIASAFYDTAGMKILIADYIMLTLQFADAKLHIAEKQKNS